MDRPNSIRSPYIACPPPNGFPTTTCLRWGHGHRHRADTRTSGTAGHIAGISPADQGAWRPPRRFPLLGSRVRRHRHLHLLRPGDPVRPVRHAVSDLRADDALRVHPPMRQVRGGDVALSRRRRGGERLFAGIASVRRPAWRPLHPRRLLPDCSPERPFRRVVPCGCCSWPHAPGDADNCRSACRIGPAERHRHQGEREDHRSVRVPRRGRSAARCGFRRDLLGAWGHRSQHPHPGVRRIVLAAVAGDWLRCSVPRVLRAREHRPARAGDARAPEKRRL